MYISHKHLKHLIAIHLYDLPADTIHYDDGKQPFNQIHCYKFFFVYVPFINCMLCFITMKFIQ